MVLTLCADVETSVSMPSVLATACCSGVVIKPLIRSALAPGYTVVMVIVVFDSFGNWRIGSLDAACSPTSRISKLITVASTGR